MKRVGRGASGLTFLEVLLAGVIGVVVLGGAYMVYEAGQSTVLASERKANLQQNARIALDLITRQIRLAGYLNGGRTRNWIAIGANNLLVIRGDVQNTGAVALDDTLIGVLPAGTGVCVAPPSGPASPCLVTGNTVYQVGGANAVIAFNVSAVNFTYFDQFDNPLLVPLDGVGPGAYPDGIVAASPLPGPTTVRDTVCRIQVQLTAVDNNAMAGPGIGQNPQQVVLTSDVRLRNAPPFIISAATPVCPS